jgi:hypothetical protein
VMKPICFPRPPGRSIPLRLIWRLDDHHPIARRDSRAADGLTSSAGLTRTACPGDEEALHHALGDGRVQSSSGSAGALIFSGLLLSLGCCHRASPRPPGARVAFRDADRLGLSRARQARRQCRRPRRAPVCFASTPTGARITTRWPANFLCFLSFQRSAFFALALRSDLGAGVLPSRTDR